MAISGGDATRSDAMEESVTPQERVFGREQVPSPDLLLSRVLLNERELVNTITLFTALRRADRELLEKVASDLADDLVKTTKSDRKLIEQRSDSLATELERRAGHLLALGKEERSADQREYGALIEAVEQRRIAAHDQLENTVQDWRASDREARLLQAEEYSRRLIELNNNHKRTQDVLNNTVSREVFQAEKESLQGQVVKLDRALLGMTPQGVSDRVHAEITARTEAALIASSKVLDTKIEVAQRQIAELKEYVDKNSGRSSGMSALYGWIVAGMGLMISVIILANTLLK